MERVLRKATERLGYKEMKPEQEKLVKEFISSRDVFGILPTGFGKSLCYGCWCSMNYLGRRINR